MEDPHKDHRRDCSTPPFAHTRPAPAGLLTMHTRQLFWAVAAISVFTNLLMLTGPVFMLQIYDRVLSSRSEETLVVLFAIVAFLYIILGLLDHARARIAARLGAQMQDRLDLPVFRAALRASNGADASAARAPQDLSLLQGLSGSPAVLAIFDFPWVPLFIGVIALLHPWLGVLALGSAATLVVMGMANSLGNRSRITTGQFFAQRSDQIGQQIALDMGYLRALGMQEPALMRWREQRRKTLDAMLWASDGTGRFSASARALRLFLQSTMLAAGALLVLRDALSPGAMIAASIILGRALGPLDQIIGGWPQLQAARIAWQRTRQLLTNAPPTAKRIALPAPSGQLTVSGLSLQAPGKSGAERSLLRDVSFMIAPGQAMGVIGPSGAGKSSLAMALVGVRPPTRGEIRLDGARLGHYPPEDLARAMGYLPQRAILFPGSLRDNIARFDPDAQDEWIIAAARAAGAHEMILALPRGYETSIDHGCAGLSGGQVQRIGLARALYRDPAVLVLDEPNANLDDDGSRALNSAVRAAKARGASVVIMAHRPSAIAECDLLMKLEAGQVVALGPVAQVLRQVTRNSTEILRTHHPLPTDPDQLANSALLRFPWDNRLPECRR